MIKIKNGKDFAAIFTALIFFIPIINYYINYIIQSYVDVSISMAVYIALYLMIIVSYLYTMRRSLLPIGLLGIVLIVYLTTALIFPQNTEYMFGELLDAAYNPFYRIVFLGLPLVFLPPIIKDTGTLYRWMNRLSHITILIALYTYYFIVIGQGKSFEYMTFSYQLLLPLCFCFITAVKKKQVLWIIIDVIGFVSIVTMGSRGAMVSAILFFAVYSIFSMRQKITTTKLLFMVIGFLVLLIAVINLKTIVQELYDSLLASGFDSRSLRRLLDGTLFEDSSRNRLREIVIQSIWDSPIVGNGIFGDRYVTAKLLGEGMYAHNIILELICHYGIFAGTVIVVVYCFNAIKTLFNKMADKNMLLVYVSVFSTVFFKMFVTGSYLGNQEFYLLVGCILCVRKLGKCRQALSAGENIS